MISANNISLQYGKRILFDEVNISFAPGNCYGVIGANGAGKSTLLKILAGELDANTGNISIEPGKRMAVLSQEHNSFDNHTVLDTVMKGHKALWDLMRAKDEIYMKPDFSDADGIKAAELEEQFAEMDGWNAEPDAATLLSGIGIHEEFHHKSMSELDGSQKVRVLLAQALFGDPDILILDEPTNDLDIKTVTWLEDFLLDFKNTVIVVSHDRHFLDTVGTHIVDIDFSKVNLYTGNYTFWYESSQLALRQKLNQNKKAETKKAELQAFIDRFSANASKSKQATAKKKLLQKINVADIKPSSRKYPGIIWTPKREVGDQILEVKNLSKTLNGELLFSNVNFTMNNNDKITLLGDNSVVIDAFYEILSGRMEADTGKINWGQTITMDDLPNDHEDLFHKKVSLIDWLRDYSENKDEAFIRGFLGKMLFSGQESLKMANVLSGGEKVRCMLSKLMLSGANFIMLNEPTNHLDLETITALNNSLINFGGNVIFTSRDHAFTQSIANRVIELHQTGCHDSLKSFDEYLSLKETVS